MITISIENATLADLNMLNLSQKAYRAFQSYWNGTEDEFLSYMRQNNLDYDFKASNINELGIKTDKFLQDFSEAVKKDIGKFDFRLRSSLTPRNLKPIETEDYSKVTLKSDDENFKEIIDSFLKLKSRSFIDFRDFNKDTNELTFIYNRRGIFDENERIAILKSRNSVTMSDNFQQAKDNNFILSGICYELAKAHNIDFRTEYVGVGDVLKEIVVTADKILNVATQKEAQKEEAITQKIIQDTAKSEIIRENSQTRQSLSEDSTEQEILKEGNTEIRISTEPGKSLDDRVEKSIDLYEQKEIEKMRIKLAKARDEAQVAYQDAKAKIENGMTIYESLNYIKQKYREEHTVNMASAFLTKDMLEVMNLKQEISTLNDIVEDLNSDMEIKNNEITKREETISSLKGTVQTKVNELNLAIEKHQEELKVLTNEAKKNMQELKGGYENEIARLNNFLSKKDSELATQDELIARLQAQNELLEKKNTELMDTLMSSNFFFIARLQAQNELLEKKNTELMDTLMSSKNSSEETIARLQAQNELLEKKNTELMDTLMSSKNSSEETIARLQAQNELLEKKNTELMDTLNNNKSIFSNNENKENIDLHQKNTNFNQKNGIISDKQNLDTVKGNVDELKKILNDEKTSNDKKREILSELRVNDILNENEVGEGRDERNSRKQ